jgi:hypothetical protein
MGFHAKLCASAPEDHYGNGEENQLDVLPKGLFLKVGDIHIPQLHSPVCLDEMSKQQISEARLPFPEYRSSMHNGTQNPCSQHT